MKTDLADLVGDILFFVATGLMVATILIQCVKKGVF